ncbi:hypothetical protein KI387_031513, partial [Taxus chinensis]
MGAARLKWSQEEEAALRVGVEKYGPGKWTAILKDPVLGAHLALRSNVDLKDKWRNINVNAWGSRKKPISSDQSGMNLASHSITNGRSDVAESVKPVVPSLQRSNAMRFIPRLDILIMDAIANLKEPKGSRKSTIAMYIEDNYFATPNFEKLLSSKLNSLTACGKLVKVGQNYIVNRNPLPRFGARKSAHLRQGAGGKRISAKLGKMGQNYRAGRSAHLRQGTGGKCNSKLDKNTLERLREEIPLPTESEIDTELSIMTTMSVEEAYEFAAECFYEAELAKIEAEQAKREAEAAEAEAQAAKAFAQAAIMNLRNSRKS